MNQLQLRVNILQELRVLTDSSALYPQMRIQQDLHRFLLSEEYYAYLLQTRFRAEKLELSPASIKAVIDKLRLGTFKFTHVPLPLGRPATATLHQVIQSGAGSPADRIVQEIIRNVLEAIYRPHFSTNSYGFGNERGHYVALREMYTNFRGSPYWVEGCVVKYDYEFIYVKLLRELSEKISDQRFIMLIAQFLSAGYMEGRFSPIAIGYPGNLNSVLNNIYLLPFDQFIEGLTSKYVRYGNTWVLTASSTKAKLTSIRRQMFKYCRGELGFGLKDLPLVDTRRKPILFLDTLFQHFLVKMAGSQARRLDLQLTAPIPQIMHDLHIEAYHVNFFSVVQSDWFHFPPDKMVQRTNQIIRQHIGYYFFAANYAELADAVKWIMREVLLITLAHKLQLGTKAAVIENFGPDIQIKSSCLLDTTQQRNFIVFNSNLPLTLSGCGKA